MIPLKDNVNRRTFPFINLLFIGLNIAAFVNELRLPGEASLQALIMAGSLIPSQLLSSPLTEWPTVFFSMFLHGSWGHIIGNMLYLWIFGDNVEDRMGHVRYFFFYLLVGTAAAMAQVYVHPRSSLPMLGASGAVSGVMGAYFVLYPRARVLAVVPIWVFLRVVEIPALFFLGFWFIFQAFQGLGSLSHRAFYGQIGGVAWWAHAGGFVAGLLLVGFFKKSQRR